jgi:hypothetical protein
VDSFYVFGRQRECSADSWPALVYLAAFFFGIVRNAAFAAFAASYAFPAPFGLPAHDEVPFKVPDNSSPDPSIEHGREYVVLYLSARGKFAASFLWRRFNKAVSFRVWKCPISPMPALRLDNLFY